MKKYYQTLITYIDILGFKEKIRNNSCDEIYKILKSFYKVTDEKGDFKRLIDLKAITFSDTSLRLYKIKSLPFGLLLSEIISLGMIQCHLLFQDTLIRGCIHIGDLFFSGKTFYGPALIDAYNIEKDSVNPMIVLSAKISEILWVKENHPYENDVLVKNDRDDISLLLFKDDDLYYLNYLKVMAGVIEKNSVRNGIIIKHKELIIKNMKKYATCEKIMTKYIWLANYHNTFLLNNLKPGFSKELLIEID